MADPRRLLDDEQARWEPFLATIRAVDRARRDEPGATAEGWTAKDAVFHVAWWLEECARVLEDIREDRWDPEGEPADGAAVDAINAGHPAVARTMSWDEVVVTLEAARARARAAFEALTDVTRDAWSWFEESGPIHYDEHAPSLAALRGGAEGAG